MNAISPMFDLRQKPTRQNAHDEIAAWCGIRFRCKERSMKTLSLLAAAAAALAFVVPAAAAPDADAAAKLSKDSGCTKCHAVDKTKKGPSFQKTAAKYKGKSDAEAKLIEFVTKSPKVKLDDGTEEEHKAVKSDDAAQVKNLVQWILAQ
jgi:cytochrome c